MSFKSLLFCADEKAARAVTQILSELDFTVEAAGEPFAAVKKLNDEQFDALVVDCQNEQDAALLFKTAKSSSQNHSALSVAVVDGQMAVARAFRIGANLVLNKPINVDQAKGTLRVARGLLRKGQAKPAAAVAPAATPVTPASEEASAGLKIIAPFPPVASPAVSNLIPIMQSAPKPAVTAEVTSSPFSAFEVEKDASPAPEAADAAVLESLHAVSPKAATLPIAPLGHTESIAGSSAGIAAAAVAPALEKKPAELGVAGAAPMFTNEPIVKEESTAMPVEVSAPSFSSLETATTRGSDSGSGIFRKLLVLTLLGVAGYYAWQNLQPLQYLPQLLKYLHRSETVDTAGERSQAAPQETRPSPPVTAPQPTAQISQTSVNTAPAVVPAPSTAAGETPGAISAGDVDSDSGKHPAAQNAAAPETIELQELPLSRTGKPTVTKTTIAPQPKPLQVKTSPIKTGSKAMPAQPAAPTLQIADGSNSDAAFTNLVSTPTELPKAAHGTVRVSQGVSQGLLLKKVAPTYPLSALQMHKSGVVQLLATINREGSISNVKILGGDPTLAQAAADAVLRWKYRPYLLNGQPVEIETQISIVFKAP